jgi:hypothetical protein
MYSKMGLRGGHRIACLQVSEAIQTELLSVSKVCVDLSCTLILESLTRVPTMS